TLADDRLEAFYDNPNALRDYFRDIGRMVLAAEGRKANDSHADCYQYFCVPEYGTANGRLHFHAVHFMRTLPTGSVDPNFGQIGRASCRERVKGAGGAGGSTERADHEVLRRAVGASC